MHMDLINDTSENRIVPAFGNRVKLIGDDELDGETQLVTFTSWMKNRYESLRAKTRQPGQALVLAGPVDCGKSLLQQIITAILGGRSAKAMRYMSGKTEFNADLIGAEHLVLEDEQSSTDMRFRLNMGARIKEIAVNDVHSCHGKGKDAVSLRPFWTLSISLNDQEENLLVLPPITQDLADKLILLRCQKPKAEFPTGTHRLRAAYWQKILSEVPAFAHYLVNYSIPPQLADRRFGVRYFHHPALIASLQSLAPEAKLLELIDRELWQGTTDEWWEGSAAELEARLRAEFSEVKHEAGRLFSWGNACAAYLGRLETQGKGERVQRKRTGQARNWIIFKSSNFSS